MKTTFWVSAIVSLIAVQPAHAAGLQYPSSCTNKVLEAAAKKNGCSLESGGSHYKVMKDGQMITTIPYSVKQNDTCRSIIKVLNANC